jgi:hypothetical protein
MCAGPPAPWLRSSPPSGFHGLYVRQLPAFAPAFPLRSADDARDRDIGVDGIMNHAPSAGLVWWQGRQVGQVMAAAIGPANPLDTIWWPDHGRGHRRCWEWSSSNSCLRASLPALLAIVMV